MLTELARSLQDLLRGCVPCFKACLAEIGNRVFCFLSSLEDRDDVTSPVERAEEDFAVLEKLILELCGDARFLSS